MSRWKAAAIHLSLSALVAALVFSLIFFVWYPPPLFSAMGGSELILLMIGIDLVLGPLLTLIVFRSGKSSLRFDLSTIAVLQAAALIYGMVIVWLARPVFIVSRGDVAYVVTDADFRPEDLAKGSRPEFQSLPVFGPQLAAVEPPTDEAQRQRVLDLFMSTGRDIHQLPEFFQPWGDQRSRLLERADKLEDLYARKQQFRDEIDAWLLAHGKQLTEVRYISLLTRVSELVLAVDAGTGDYLGLIDIDGS